MRYAAALRCPRVHVMAGKVPAGQTAASVRQTYIDHMRYAAQQAAALGVDILIEPLNPRDQPNYFLAHQDDAHALVVAIGEPNVKVQFDLYHCQITEGDVATKLRQYLPTGRVGHIQIAGVPLRHEPNIGELNYRDILNVLDQTAAACGWQGWVGCEYHPALGAVAGGTSAGLGWLKNCAET